MVTFATRLSSTDGRCSHSFVVHFRPLVVRYVGPFKERLQMQKHKYMESFEMAL